MRKIFFLFLVIASGFAGFAQAEITVEGSGIKVVKGFMSRQDLETDSAFSWFPKNLQAAVPNADAVKAFAANRDSVHILVFAGTWCSDSRGILPQFFSVADAAGFPGERVTMIGVDRQKKTLFRLSEAFAVTHVPTFIVLKNGREIGRVVEYGRYGMVDRELGEIISGTR